MTGSSDPAESKMRAKISALEKRIEKYEKILSVPQHNLGSYVTGRSGRKPSMDRALNRENDRRASTFAAKQQALSDLRFLEIRLSSYLAGTHHANGLPVAERKEPPRRERSAPKYDTRKIRQDLSIYGESTLPDGRIVSLEIDFDAPGGGGYRWSIRSGESVASSRFYKSISQMNTRDLVSILEGGSNS